MAASSECVNLDLTYPEVMRIICSFKKQGCLWNPHLTDFRNRQAKTEAWLVVAAESGIEVAVCKRKMKSLMSSGRREKARIINSRRSGNPEDVLEPTWRYWNILKFTRGLEDDDDDPLGTAPEMDILDPTLGVGAMKAKVKHSESVDKSNDDKFNEHISKEYDENTDITLRIASQLRKMYPDQREFAMKLINEVLLKAVAEQLTPHVHVRTPDFSDKLSVIQKPETVSNSSTNSVNNIQSAKTEFVSCPCTFTAHSLDPGSHS